MLGLRLPKQSFQVWSAFVLVFTNSTNDLTFGLHMQKTPVYPFVERLLLFYLFLQVIGGNSENFSSLIVFHDYLKNKQKFKPLFIHLAWRFWEETVFSELRRITWVETLILLNSIETKNTSQPKSTQKQIIKVNPEAIN